MKRSIINGNDGLGTLFKNQFFGAITLQLPFNLASGFARFV